MKTAKTLLVALSLITVPAFAGQEPSFDLQFAVPKFSADESAEVLVASTPDKLSCHFVQAPIANVFRFLQEKGVNFVMPDSEFKKDKTVTLNIVDQPLETVMDALADALGGRWTKKNNIYVFHLAAPTYLPNVFGLRPGNKEGDVFKYFNFDGQKPPATGYTVPFDFQKQFGLQGQDLQKQLKDLPKVGDLFRQDGQNFKPAPNLKDLPMVGDLFKQNGQNFKMPFVFRTQNLGDLLKSLTKEQRDLQTKRGYLLPSDLTPHQKSMIGIPESGAFEFTFITGPDKVVIKGESGK